jgi:CRISPR-associated protein Cas2
MPRLVRRLFLQVLTAGEDLKMLIAYDVSTSTPKGQHRLRRVARVCEDYGQRVQKSVFECVVGPSEWATLRQRLLDEADLHEDSLRFYFLDAGVQVEHHGVNEPVDLQGPLVI